MEVSHKTNSELFTLVKLRYAARGKRPAVSYCVSAETHKSEGQTGCWGAGLTLEVSRLPLLFSELIDS